tara:strand:+ start:771 stop:2003 length:1233 start_codon:yes stop_codon:yes gene_type:complete
MKIQSVRGTHDLYGDNIKKFNRIKEVITYKGNLQSFNELQTPIFELSELFSKPLGEQSDVVLKEMYSFKDRGDDSLTLRPEFTTPMIRAAISNNLLKDIPLKIFGIGPMFRRERPQKGRYRQFNQINFEIFGSDDYMSDLELIVLADDILNSLIPNVEVTLNLNTLGQRNNLKEYKSILSKYFDDNKLKLSKESREKIYKNPLRILDSKQESDVEVSNSAPIIYDYISTESKLNFDQLCEGLRSFNIKYEINNNLVRGLDYYCGTVFEFKTKSLGSQDTLLGGGRYDGLIGLLGGPDIPGVGWAAGIERISMLMKEETKKNNHVHIAINDEKLKVYLQKIIMYLKENKISFYWNYKYNLKKSLSKANSSDAKVVLIVGEKEYQNDTCTLKILQTGEQTEVKINEIKNYLK